MQLRPPVLRVLTAGCLVLSLASCGSDDRLDKIVEQQEEILKELRGLASSHRSLVNRGIMAVPEQALRNKKGKFLGWEGEVQTPKPGRSPRKGPENAKITVIEYADFECPFCARMAGVADELIAAHPGQVNFVYKHYPLKKHENALPAARASWAALQQGKFWEMHDLIFQSGDASAEGTRAHAEKLGLDMERFDRDVPSRNATIAVFAERKSGRMAGVDSTPTFFVGDRLVKVTSKEALKLAVANALQQADAANGTAAAAPAPLP